jgi:hypothetical protein
MSRPYGAMPFGMALRLVSLVHSALGLTRQDQSQLVRPAQTPLQAQACSINNPSSAA